MTTPVLTPGTKRIIARNRQARLLLEWWEATNDPADRSTRLASDTRKWLAHLPTDVPSIDSALAVDYESDLTPAPLPLPLGHNDTTAQSDAHELRHAQLRMIDEGGPPDEDHRSSANIPHTESDKNARRASSSQE